MIRWWKRKSLSWVTLHSNFKEKRKVFGIRTTLSNDPFAPFFAYVNLSDLDHAKSFLEIAEMLDWFACLFPARKLHVS